MPADMSEHYRFRDELAERMIADLLGPAHGENETLDEAPSTAYITGILFPKPVGGHKSREVDEEEARHDNEKAVTAKQTIDETTDLGVSMANRQLPQSMGLTFAVDTDLSDGVAVDFIAARYVPVNATTGEVTSARHEESRSTESDGIHHFSC